MHNQFVNINGVTVVSDTKGNIKVLKQEDNIEEILEKENEIESLKNTIEVVNNEYTSSLKEYDELEETLKVKKEDNKKVIKKNTLKTILFTFLTFILTYGIGKLCSIGLTNTEMFINIFSAISGCTMLGINIGNIINSQIKYKKAEKRLKFRKDRMATKSMSTLGKRMELEEKLIKLVSNLKNISLETENIKVNNLENNFKENEEIKEKAKNGIYYPYILNDEKGQRLTRRK